MVDGYRYSGDIQLKFSLVIITLYERKQCQRVHRDDN